MVVVVEMTVSVVVMVEFVVYVILQIHLACLQHAILMLVVGVLTFSFHAANCHIFLETKIKIIRFETVENHDANSKLIYSQIKHYFSEKWKGIIKGIINYYLY